MVSLLIGICIGKEALLNETMQPVSEAVMLIVNGSMMEILLTEFVVGNLRDKKSSGRRKLAVSTKKVSSRKITSIIGVMQSEMLLRLVCFNRLSVNRRMLVVLLNIACKTNVPVGFV